MDPASDLHTRSSFQRLFGRVESTRSCTTCTYKANSRVFFVRSILAIAHLFNVSTVFLRLGARYDDIQNVHLYERGDVTSSLSVVQHITSS